MGLRRVLLRGFGVAVCGTLPLWMSAAPASAFEAHTRSDVVEHTFTDFAGDSVTCTIEVVASLFRETSSAPYHAEASTQVLLGLDNGQPDRQACDALVEVDITYRDVSGGQRRASAFGVELADLQLDQVAGTFQATHAVFFQNCSANCEADLSTRPK